MLPVDIYKSSSQLSEHSQGCSCPIHIAPAPHSSVILPLLMLHCHFVLVLSIAQQTHVVTKGQVLMILSDDHTRNHNHDPEL